MDKQLAVLAGEMELMRQETAGLVAERDQLKQQHDEVLEQVATMRRTFDQVKVTIPRIEVLLAEGASKAEALATVVEHVQKANDYLAQLRKAMPETPVKLSREETGPYRVLEGKQVSIGGCITVITPGTIVDLRSYGANGIARLREQGVKMELVKQ